MDKNVGSVDLEELKAAREALDRERGVETDPNMYNDYDPEGHKAEREQEKLARMNESNSNDSDSASDVSADEIQEVPANDFSYESVSTSLNSDDETSIISDFDSSSNNELSEELTESDEDIVASLLDAFDISEEKDDAEIVSPETNSDEIEEEIKFEDSEDVNEIENSLSELKTENSAFDDYARSPENEAESVAATLDSSGNFDIYDNFADFEINSESDAHESIVQPVLANETENEKEELSSVSEPTENASASDNNLDDFLSELDTILAQDSDDSEIADDVDAVIEEDKTDDVIETVDDLEEEKTDISNDMLSQFDLFDNSNEETVSSEIDVQEETSSSDVELEIKNDEEETIEAEDDVEETINIEPEVQEKPAAVGLDRFMVDESSISYSDEELAEKQEDKTEILTDFSKLSEIAEEIEAENLIAENELLLSDEESEKENAMDDSEIDDLEDDESKPGEFSKIKNFNFVDVMSTKEFENADNFSYVLGKNSEDEIVFSNLRDTCGTAIFARNEDVIFEQFSSILLSLLIKNTPNDIQFVICDAMYDSDFDVFANSSYMYFNRVAKNNREIVDTLLELSKELENRYNNLVYSGVKSISAYNMQVEERGGNKMPYVVLFINNYAKMNQFLDSDRINVCLHNILKFGRLVGVYAIVASTSEIERKDVNFNLPTRISYKAEDEHASIAALGREGAENLKDEKDFLYSTIYDEEMKHLKVPSISKEEIELIIENLEN